MARTFKRNLVMADLHCGHLIGLTPPKWWEQFIPGHTDEEGEPATSRQAAAVIEQELWEWFASEVDALKPIDNLFANGDLIDGKGEKSGGTELRVSDRNHQCQMAAECLLYPEAERIYITYGTPYHSGQSEDFEDNVAEKVGAVEIGSQLWVEVNGVVFDLKHQVGRSSVPYGGLTPIAKEAIINQLEAEKEEEPNSDILIRSHTHQFWHCGNGDWLALTTPALQAKGTKFGARRVVGGIQIGFVYFDVYEDGSFRWQARRIKLASQRPQVLQA